jgi:tetrahydromethanopterin S-methyltransferase subunit F
LTGIEAENGSVEARRQGRGNIRSIRAALESLQDETSLDEGLFTGLTQTRMHNGFATGEAALPEPDLRKSYLLTIVIRI